MGTFKNYSVKDEDVDVSNLSRIIFLNGSNLSYMLTENDLLVIYILYYFCIRQYHVDLMLTVSDVITMVLFYYLDSDNLYFITHFSVHDASRRSLPCLY